MDRQPGHGRSGIELYDIAILFPLREAHDVDIEASRAAHDRGQVAATAGVAVEERAKAFVCGEEMVEDELAALPGDGLEAVELPVGPSQRADPGNARKGGLPAAQVRGGVCARIGEGRRRRVRPAEEKEIQCPDDIGNVDRSVIIGVVGGQAFRLLIANEEKRQGEDGITDIQHAIIVGVAADKVIYRIVPELDPAARGGRVQVIGKQEDPQEQEGVRGFVEGLHAGIP